jgi:hypothetical protein
MVELAERTTGPGKTYHLMDPHPLTYRDFYASTLKAMGFSGPQIKRPLNRLIKLLCSRAFWPITQKSLQRFGMPAEMLVHANYTTTYSTDNTNNDLRGSGISCPPVPDYLETIIAYFEHNLA